MTAQRPPKAKSGMVRRPLKAHARLRDGSCRCGATPPNDRSWRLKDLAQWHRDHKLAAAVSDPHQRSGK